jgi:hypothetical protein
MKVLFLVIAFLAGSAGMWYLIKRGWIKDPKK